MKHVARWPRLVFEVRGKRLLDLVILVFAAQLFLIGCGSSLNKKDNDAGANAGNDSGPGDSDNGTTGPEHAGGSGGTGASGGAGGIGQTSDGGGMGGAGGLGDDAGASGGVGGIGNTDLGRANVSAGSVYTCAIKINGTLFCWGDNASGQLGDSTMDNSDVPVQESTSASDWANVSAGYGHTCAIKTNGELYCWGYNEYGQLGNNSPTESRVPVQESTSASDWARVSAGGEHTCATKTDGTLFCWGDNLEGQLGANSPIYGNNPIPKQESTAASDWANVSAGGSHTCAIKTNGTLFCWGAASKDQLGNDSTALYHTNPILFGPGSLLGSSTAYSPVPVQEGTAASDWTNISAGSDYACAIKTNGTLFCWGADTYGKLGRNSSTGIHVPVQESTAASDWARVSAGHNHACAVKTNDTLFCWGSNEYGQLGNNSTTNSSIPVQESTAASDWTNVSAGVRHTCAIKTNGTLFCWGNNDSGDLGNNSATSSHVPAPVSMTVTN
jgi:alpha-tubulin suppressor-like RCC1 family protein